MSAPSKDWTPDERLKVIEQKSRRLFKLLQPPLASFDDQKEAFHLVDEIFRLAGEQAEFLESNRSRLLEGIEL